MKIITRLTDSELSNLFNKYNYYNIMKCPEGKSRLWYLIPPELVINTYSSSSIEIYDLTADGLDLEWDNWVGCNALGKILNICCNLSTQEYFDLLVLHINDTDNRPKCDYCGLDLKWSGRVTAGYGSGGHLWDESDRHFCEPGHTILYRNSHLDEYPDLNDFFKSGGAWAIQHNNPDQYDPCGFRDYKVHIETMRSKFKNQGSPDDECYFYIASTSNGFKFGITSDLDTRLNLFDTYNKVTINKIKVTDYGKRAYIADLEAEIKYKLHTSTEFIDWSRVKEFIKYYKEVIDELKDVIY